MRVARRKDAGRAFQTKEAAQVTASKHQAECLVVWGQCQGGKGWGRYRLKAGPRGNKARGQEKRSET